MGILEKMTNAPKTNWVSEGFSKTEVKTMVELAKKSAQIERVRIEKEMNQQKLTENMRATKEM